MGVVSKFFILSSPNCKKKKNNGRVFVFEELYIDHLHKLNTKIHHLYLRNRKHFPCFHSYKNTSGCLEEREIEVVRVFSRNFEFSQASTSVSRTYRNTGEMFSKA